MSPLDQALESLSSSPRLFPTYIDMQNRNLTFHELGREDYSEATWLDFRQSINSDLKLSFQELNFRLRPVANKRARPANYIFHTSHCGSTLLSRCLDQLPECFALKEPSLLNQLSLFYRHHLENGTLDNQLFQFILRTSVTLLSRTFQPSETALIKLPSICTNLITALVGNSANSRGLFLYERLGEFLVSLNKNDERVKYYLDNYFPIVIKDLRLMGLSLPDDSDQLSISKKTAAIWLSKFLFYTEAERALPVGTLTSIEFSQFKEDPYTALCSIANHFSYGITEKDIEQICTKGPLGEYSKSPNASWDPEDDLGTRKRIGIALKHAIEEAEEWVDSISPNILSKELMYKI